jgi:hypothetical protein
MTGADEAHYVSNGTGNGTVNYSVSKNANTARVGAIAIANQIVPVTQIGVLPTLNFDTGISIPVVSQVTAVASGDFNRDGKQDAPPHTAHGDCCSISARLLPIVAVVVA